MIPEESRLVGHATAAGLVRTGHTPRRGRSLAAALPAVAAAIRAVGLLAAVGLLTSGSGLLAAVAVGGVVVVTAGARGGAVSALLLAVAAALLLLAVAAAIAASVATSFKEITFHVFG